MSISRRMLLASAGIAPVAAHANSTSMQAQHVDVIIVGAGAAGLETARLLIEKGKSVVVLEASPVIGGRIRLGKLAGKTIDLGAQWVGPGQNRLYARAKSLGISTTPQSIEGDSVTLIADRAYRSGGGESFPAADLAEFQKVIGTFTQLASEIDPEKAWDTDNAARLDSQSVAKWLEQSVESTIIQALIASIIRIVCCVEPSQISMLGWARYMASAGGILPLIDVVGGAQQDTFVGGAHQIVQKTATMFEHHIVLNAPVSMIKQHETGVSAFTAAGEWTADCIVVTPPPSIATRIMYEPPLPADRDTLGQRMPMGSVIKCLIAFETPFWRDIGLSGQVTSDRDFLGFFEKSLHGSSNGALVGFFAGVKADYWAKKSRAERRYQVLETISAAFSVKPPKPIDYVDYVWKDNPWIRGGYTSIPMPDTLAPVGDTIAKPNGRIHWAGTETSSEWTGYIEGALASAHRVVAEVLFPAKL